MAGAPDESSHLQKESRQREQRLQDSRSHCILKHLPQGFGEHVDLPFASMLTLQVMLGWDPSEFEKLTEAVQQTHQHAISISHCHCLGLMRS